jgi:hypothetical protein
MNRGCEIESKGCAVSGSRERVRAEFRQGASDAVEHEVKLMDFTRWPDRVGSSPRELTGRKRLRSTELTAVCRSPLRTSASSNTRFTRFSLWSSSAIVRRPRLANLDCNESWPQLWKQRVTPSCSPYRNPARGQSASAFYSPCQSCQLHLRFCHAHSGHEALVLYLVSSHRDCARHRHGSAH